MARFIADETKTGQELVTFALTVFRDTNAPIEDRKWAMEWLADRGAGKAPAVLEVQSSHTTTLRLDLSMYTLEELDQMERINRAAEARKLEKPVIDVLPASTTP